MRTISPQLKAEIAAGTIARLLKIACQDGQVFAFTDHDRPLTVDGVTYDPSAGLQSVKYVATADVQVSNQEVGAAVVDVPEEDLLGGVFDGADVEASWASWRHPEHGRLVTFKGTIGEVSWDEGSFLADIVSFMRQLERNVGQVVTSSCRHELFGAGGPGLVGRCGLDPAAFTFAGTIAAVTLPKWKFTMAGAAAARPDGYLANGVLTWTSGRNAGLSVTVKTQVGAAVELFLPAAFTVDAGDAFTVVAGCDKTLATCRDRFANVANFGGFPHVNTDVGYR
jgi:uncharacterized phage protein (TIGR02218 family)